MKVRLLKDEDKDILGKLFFQTVRQVCLGDYSKTQVEVWAPENRDMKKWYESFKGKIVFVAEENKIILGFGELESSGHIDRFYIASEHVGKGIGKIIYKHIEEEARLKNLNKLYVEASITAKAFFERMGFNTLREQL